MFFYVTSYVVLFSWSSFFALTFSSCLIHFMSVFLFFNCYVKHFEWFWMMKFAVQELENWLVWGTLASRGNSWAQGKQWIFTQLALAGSNRSYILCCEMLNTEPGYWSRYPIRGLNALSKVLQELSDIQKSFVLRSQSICKWAWQVKDMNFRFRQKSITDVLISWVPQSYR